MRKFAAPLGLMLVLLPVAALAATPNPEAKILIHLVPEEGGKRPECALNLTCRDAGIRGDTSQTYYAFVIVAGADTSKGIAGVQFGISYNDSAGVGVDIDSWHKCAQMQWHLGDWPGANSGNLLTWAQITDCQRTDPVVVGYFVLTAHSPDRLKIIPRPVDGIAALAACGMNQINVKELVDNVKPENMGWVDFGGGPGYNPCDPEQNTLELQKRFKPIGGGN